MMKIFCKIPSLLLSRYVTGFFMKKKFFVCIPAYNLLTSDFSFVCEFPVLFLQTFFKRAGSSDMKYNASFRILSFLTKTIKVQKTLKLLFSKANVIKKWVEDSLQIVFVAVFSAFCALCSLSSIFLCQNVLRKIGT